jgi:hypothetical protein
MESQAWSPATEANTGIETLGIDHQWTISWRACARHARKAKVQRAGRDRRRYAACRTH